MDSLVDWAASRLAVEVFTDGIVKATIILGIAWLATTLLRRASAAVRHSVWSLALAGLLTLPILSFFLPPWNVGMPAGIQPLLIYSVADDPPGLSTPGVLPAEERPRTTDASEQPVVVEPSGEVRLDPPGEAPPDAGYARTLASSARPLGLPLPAWILLVWGIGAVVLGGRLWLHVMRVWVITRHAELLADARRAAEVARLARRLGIRRRVRVLHSPDVSMAMTWGLWRPVVMVPHEAGGWSEERWRVVLLHELAHVKRWDYLIHLTTQVVRVCYWFNPLVWVAARRIHVEQERACDDQVLQAGAGACDYATHLLDIARSFLKCPVSLPGGITVVRGSTLKERVLAILNAHSNRHALSLKTGLAAACLGTCLVLPVATLQLGAPALGFDAAPPVVSARALPLSAGPAAMPAADALRAADPVVWHQAALSAGLDDAALTDLLRHEETTLRERAAWALGQRGARQAVAPLLAALADEEVGVRLQVIRALGQLEDRRALDPLEAMLDDPCADVRAASVRALEKICRCHTLEAVPAALSDQHPRVRTTAAYVLGEAIRGLRTEDTFYARRALRDHLPSAVDALIGALRDESPSVRQQVAYALGEARDDAAVEALAAAIHDPAAVVRLEALRALGKIGVSCAASAVRLALGDQDPAVRAAAARVLDQLDA